MCVREKVREKDNEPNPDETDHFGREKGRRMLFKPKTDRISNFWVRCGLGLSEPRFKLRVGSKTRRRDCIVVNGPFYGLNRFLYIFLVQKAFLGLDPKKSEKIRVLIVIDSVISKIN